MALARFGVWCLWGRYLGFDVCDVLRQVNMMDKGFRRSLEGPYNGRSSIANIVALNHGWYSVVVFLFLK